MASQPRTTGKDMEKPRNPRSKSKTRSFNLESLELALPTNQGTSGSGSKGMDEILSTLECPVCFEFLYAPIYMCAVGHNICSSCKLKLPQAECPMCKAPLTSLRNFALEKISSTFGTPCQNSTHGCSFVGSAAKSTAHAATCPYKQYLCPFGVTYQTCTWMGRKDNVMEHFVQKHPNKIGLNPGCNITFSDFNVLKADGDLQLFSHAGELFLYHVKIDQQNKVANWAIQFLGNKELSAMWIYEFSFYNRRTSKSLKSAEECSSNDVNINALFSGADCVSLPLNVVKKFMVLYTNLSFKFFLRRKDVRQ